jgi:hypothetical protein
MSSIHPQGPRLSPAARRCTRWAALSFTLLAALAGCRAPAPHATAPEHAQAPPPAARPLEDGSYDWHVLVVAPFGSVLKEIPLALHEVLLFRDEAHGAAAADDAECYASDKAAPRFVGRTPDEYLLCFKEDRLARIQASVRLKTAEAPEVFAAACAVWLKNAARTTTGAAAPSTTTPAAGAPPTEVQNTAVQGADTCKGRDGAIRFSAGLGEQAGRAEIPRAETPPAETSPTETTLSIILDSIPAP